MFAVKVEGGLEVQVEAPDPDVAVWRVKRAGWRPLPGARPRRVK